MTHNTVCVCRGEWACVGADGKVEVGMEELEALLELVHVGSGPCTGLMQYLGAETTTAVYIHSVTMLNVTSTLLAGRPVLLCCSDSIRLK